MKIIIYLFKGQTVMEMETDRDSNMFDRELPCTDIYIGHRLVEGKNGCRGLNPHPQYRWK